jgi:hypothetical protein
MLENFNVVDDYTLLTKNIFIIKKVWKNKYTWIWYMNY